MSLAVGRHQFAMGHLRLRSHTGSIDESFFQNRVLACQCVPCGGVLENGRCWCEVKPNGILQAWFPVFKS